MAARDGATYFAERVWGVSLRYDLGDEHPLVGRSCPDLELEDGTRIGTLLRDGNGLLLDFDRQLPTLDRLWGTFGATASNTSPTTRRIALASAQCWCVRMGSWHGRAIRLPAPMTSNVPRRDGSRVADHLVRELGPAEPRRLARAAQRARELCASPHVATTRSFVRSRTDR